MFRVPIFGNLPAALDSISISPEVARDVLIGKVLRKTVSNTNLPTSSLDFDTSSGTNDDALYYAAIDPNHDVKGLEADGLAKTCNMRRDDVENTFLEELQDQHGEDVHKEPAPPYAPANTETRTAHSDALLQAPTDESASSSGVLPQLVTQPADAASIPEATIPCPSKSTVAAQRS